MANSQVPTESQDGKIRVGTAIIKHLSTSFYPNPNMIFDELLSNSRDAMATTVELSIKPNQIIIEDDGEGMDRDELAHFFYISHSLKPLEPVKKKGRIERTIIGKFGIGKLSLYQVCKSFDITSWKDGKESRAVFDFESFEKKTFIDDFSLKIISTHATSHKNGTRIVLLGLKHQIDASNVKRHLTRTMPIARDFKIIISGSGLYRPVELRSEDVLAGNVFKKFNIDEFVDKVGQVTGTISYKTNTQQKDFGVFIRIFGRLVNVDPHSILNFSNLTHANQFDRRIYVDFNVDGLNDALQTNRAGFLIDNPKYISFVNWLKKTLNRYNKEVGEKWNVEKQKNEIEFVKDTISQLSKKMIVRQEGYVSKDYSPRTTTKKNPKHIVKSKPNKKEDHYEESENIFLIKGNNFMIDILPLGKEEPEAKLDKKRGKIIINSLHPLYQISRSQGGIWGVQYHAIHASIVLIALESSDSMKEFKQNYDRLALESHEIISNMKKRLTDIK